MAGDWIKVEHSTLDKPEVTLFAELLGVPVDHGFGLLVRFWMWLDRNSCDGVVTHVSRMSVDTVMHTPGFAGAIESVGWLIFDEKKRTATVPNFARHNGSSAKSRALTKNRMQRLRDVSVTQDASPEKRREEKKKTLRPVAPDSFARFWLAWPTSERKVAKAKCLETWKRCRLDDIADEIVAHVTAMRDSKQWRDGYDPAPLTYLRQRRWEDGVAAGEAAEARAWQ